MSTTPDTQDNTTRQKLFRFAATMTIVGTLLLLFSALIKSDTYKSYFTMLGVLLVIGLAATLLGAFVGFLFGVPKFNKNFDPNAGYAQQHQYNPNTNLEDISDWLSKIIIGVTLTQLLKIPAALMSVAKYVIANSNNDKVAYAQPVIISIIIYFLIAGFFISYCYTRVMLPDLFRLTTRNNELEGENSLLAEGARQQQAVVKAAAAPAQGGAFNESVAPNSIDPGQLLLASLTTDELNWLKQIKSDNNKYTITGTLSLNQSTSLNVLIKKGIVSIMRGDALIPGSIVSITDTDMLNSLS